MGLRLTAARLEDSNHHVREKRSNYITIAYIKNGENGRTGKQLHELLMLTKSSNPHVFNLLWNFHACNLDYF